jgi:hypothetical protein
MHGEKQHAAAQGQSVCFTGRGVLRFQMCAGVDVTFGAKIAALSHAAVPCQTLVWTWGSWDHW